MGKTLSETTVYRRVRYDYSSFQGRSILVLLLKLHTTLLRCLFIRRNVFHPFEFPTSCTKFSLIKKKEDVKINADDGRCGSRLRNRKHILDARELKYESPASAKAHESGRKNDAPYPHMFLPRPPFFPSLLPYIPLD